MNPESTSSALPILDLSPLCGTDERGADAALRTLASKMREACRTCGFFYISNHGVDPRLIARLEAVSHRFFALPEEEKREIEMARAGSAWRGYFGVGDELTSGKPDWKEGLYFGAELPAEHALVRSHTPMHGANLFPDGVPEMREVVLEYLRQLEQLGHRLMRCFALGLGLEADRFERALTCEPLILFRIFHYPRMDREQIEQRLWSVGEHTDYGLLTILLQDEVGGLEVKSQGQWVQAPPIDGTFVCNIGDMLERVTGGFYRSTPHRVLNRSGRSRLSFPFFFDPGWTAEMEAIDPSGEAVDDSQERWDGRSVHAFSGTYGEYLLEKVGHVFPDLAENL